MTSNKCSITSKTIFIIGLAIFILPLFLETLYENFYYASGLFLLLISFILSNFSEKQKLIERGEWQEKKKAMAVLCLCSAVGLSLLVYYEIQMPKYEVAIIKKNLYSVPPQLSLGQLRQLGAECNTYGNTLCSQAVFARIVKKDPRDYKALANLAMAQSHLGYHMEAIFNFNNAIQHGAKTYDVLKFYGDSLMKAGKKAQAKMVFQEALKLSPSQEKVRQRMHQIETGESVFRNQTK